MNDNVKPKLIRKHMLEEPLRAEIDDKANKAEARLVKDSIKMEDLDEPLRSKLTAMHAPTGTLAYDDSWLSGRVTELEKEHVAKKDVFDKSKDKVSQKLLDGDMSNAYNLALQIPKLADAKADKSYVEATFRKTAVKIYEGDFDKAYQDKVNKTVSAVNSLEVQNKGLTTQAAQIAKLQSDVSVLQGTKANKADIKAGLTTVSLADCDSTIQVPISKIGSFQNQINKKADYAALNDFRKTSVPLKMSDFDSDLQRDLNVAVTAGKDIRVTCEGVFDNKFNSDGKAWIYGALGQPACGDSKHGVVRTDDKMTRMYPYAFCLAATNYLGTTNGSGAMTLVGAMNMLWARLTALESTVAGVNGTASAAKSTAANAQSRVTTAEADIAALKSAVASIKARVSALETTPEEGI